MQQTQSRKKTRDGHRMCAELEQMQHSNSS